MRLLRKVFGVALMLSGGLFVAAMTFVRETLPPKFDVSYDILGLPVLPEQCRFLAAHGWIGWGGIAVILLGGYFYAQ